MEQILVQPWKTWNKVIKEDNNTDKTQHTFLVKTHFSETSYQLMVTDLQAIWWEEMNEDAITERIKALNPDIEAPVSKVLNHISKSILNRLSVPCQLSENGQKATLYLETELAGIPFLWNFQCTSLPSEEYSKHLAIPLLSMIAELNRRQQVLIDIIKQKDTEIEDYKAQGVTPSRRRLETSPFVENAFLSAATESKGFNDIAKRGISESFCTSTQKLYTAIMEKKISLDNDMVAIASIQDGNELLDDPESLTPTVQSPIKTKLSPQKLASSSESTPTKDFELQRREALAKRLAEEETKKDDRAKKKKKKGLF